MSVGINMCFRGFWWFDSCVGLRMIHRKLCRRRNLLHCEAAAACSALPNLDISCIDWPRWWMQYEYVQTRCEGSALPPTLASTHVIQYTSRKYLSSWNDPLRGLYILPVIYIVQYRWQDPNGTIIIRALFHVSEAIHVTSSMFERESETMSVSGLRSTTMTI